MKKAQLFSLILTAILAACLCIGVFAAESEIKTADDLIALSKDASKWGDSFKLTADIDLGGKAFSPIGSDPSNPFTGTFDGNGHTISGLNIQADGWAGLFGVVSGGTVKNVTVKGFVNNLFEAANAESKKDGEDYGTGGIAGLVWTGSTIENCVNYAEITSPGEAGGIVGFVRNKASGGNICITNCVNYGKINSTLGNTAGIAGTLRNNIATSSIIVSGCWNHADITGTSTDRNRLAGISAYILVANGSIEILNCGNTGKLVGDNAKTDTNASIVGGIGGRIEVATDAGYFKVDACENTGDIQSTYYAGGMAGFFDAKTSNTTAPIVFSNCSNSGTISGTRYAAGILAFTRCSVPEEAHRPSVKNCLNTGAVSSTYKTGRAGGILGRWEGVSLEACVSLGTVTGTGSAGGLAGFADKHKDYPLCATTLTNCYAVTAPLYTNMPDQCVESGTAVVTTVTDINEYPALDFISTWIMTENGPALRAFNNDVSATLDDVIGLNFYIDTAFYSGATGATLANGSETAELASAQVMEDGRTRYTFYIVPAKIGTDYTFTLEGTYFKKVISVAGYLNQLSGTSAETVANALLTYGEASAAYFAKETFTETAEMEAVTADTLTGYIPAYSDTSIGDLTLAGNSFVFTEAAKTKHLFTLAEGGNIAAYTFTYQFAGEGAVPVDAVPNGNYYTVTVPGIDAKKLSKTYTLTVTKINPETKETEDTMTITYSALSYAYLLLKNSEVESLKPAVPLAKALYLYSAAAVAYEAE